MQTEIQGLSTHYIDLPGEKGPVLFLHGWGAPITLYQPVLDLLNGMGYRVAAFDMPGAGETQEPKNPMTLADYAGFTLAFCEKLGLKEAVLMGHSHGGRVAITLLADKDCPLKCEKAVFLDAAGVRPAPSAGKKLRQLGYKGLKALGTSPLTAPLFGDLYAQERDKRSSADYKAASPVMRQTMSNVLVDLTHLMPQITAQVLLVWGDRDADTPPDHGRTMERLIPGAGLALIQNAGHFCFLDNWGQFSAVLRAFL